MDSGSSSAFTNTLVPLGDALMESFSRAESVDMAVSFLMETGLSRVMGALTRALDRGVRVRIVTGTYLGITSPFVLEELLRLDGDLRVHVFSGDVPFHPKAYIFRGPDGDEAFVGSSNLSRSALSEGVEWNYRLRRSSDSESFDSFQAEFDRLFHRCSEPLTGEFLLEYRRDWVRPPVKVPVSVDVPEPRGPQISALNALASTREDGMDRALLVMATGVGKTFVAAYDSKGCDRLLFVAHRVEILRHARNQFRMIHGDRSACILADGSEYRGEEMVFASVQTLCNRLDSFDPDMFDYMVVDEFHHAPSESYRRVIEHFRPDFLLGLTATPERMDRRDVFAMCGYNVPYEISMPEAIRYGVISPFSYYGIADSVDYDNIRYVNGRYDTDELDSALMNRERAALVLAHYRRFPSERALGFCSSVSHAVFMRDFFQENGVPSRAIVSGGDSDPREGSLMLLAKGDVRVVFSVDMLNEGVDVPAVDMVVFLRPTESDTVFMQQLGRGLRISEGKERLTVLDFIGNYRNVERIPSLICGGSSGGSKGSDMVPPCGCTVNFDLGALDVIERMARRRMKFSQLVDEDFNSIMAELGRVPSRTEVYDRMHPDLLVKSRIKGGMFRDYIGYLDGRGLADSFEISLRDNLGGEFVRFVENTGMSRMYKMPLILCFMEEGGRMRVGPSDLISTFRSFYARDGNRIDLDATKHRRIDSMGDSDWYSLIYENPVHFLVTNQESARFFSLDGEDLVLNQGLERFIHLSAFRRQVEDAVALRVMDFKRMRYEKSRE